VGFSVRNQIFCSYRFRPIRATASARRSVSRCE